MNPWPNPDEVMPPVGTLVTFRGEARRVTRVQEGENGYMRGIYFDYETKTGGSGCRFVPYNWFKYLEFEITTAQKVLFGRKGLK